MPSLHQLDEAVTAFLEEHGDVELTVVVDATFGHRIADDEKAEYEEAIVNGELVTPPAGAIGRGDAFVLQIADKANAACSPTTRSRSSTARTTGCSTKDGSIGGKPVAQRRLGVRVAHTGTRSAEPPFDARDARPARRRPGNVPRASPQSQGREDRPSRGRQGAGSRAARTTKRSDRTQRKSSTAARKVSAPASIRCRQRRWREARVRALPPSSWWGEGPRIGQRADPVLGVRREPSRGLRGGGSGRPLLVARGVRRHRRRPVLHPVEGDGRSAADQCP